MLGDQKSGNNLEMPEGLLRQVFREEFGNSSAELVQLLRAVLAAVKEGHIIKVDGQTFGRTVIKTANSVNMAAGKNMFWF